ncbi:MAG: MoxR family ATPase [Isosphaeraceae bacterium]|nr:MoxR family ATPase [Isosphaeraceae bacterium]
MPTTPIDFDEASSILGRLAAGLERSIVGRRPLLDRMIIAFLAGGHVLIEGVPGLAKTRAARTMARALDLPFRRIQFTPDLLPADLTGTQIYRPATGTFDVRPGPIVTSVLLADEINRAPAKVQSALLEAMQERQITVGDETIRLPETFWVLATQNPIEHEGTYPLPESQLDRFLMKLVVDYPARDAELAMLDLPADAEAETDPIVDRATIARLRATTAAVTTVDAIKQYIVDIVRATRDPASYGLADTSALIELGAGPRASLALLATAKAHALLAGRDYVVPHDVKSIAREVLRHRLIVSFEAEAEGIAADALIDRILDRMKVP